MPRTRPPHTPLRTQQIPARTISIPTPQAKAVRISLITIAAMCLATLVGLLSSGSILQSENMRAFPQVPAVTNLPAGTEQLTVHSNHREIAVRPSPAVNHPVLVFIPHNRSADDIQTPQDGAPNARAHIEVTQKGQKATVTATVPYQRSVNLIGLSRQTVTRGIVLLIPTHHPSNIHLISENGDINVSGSFENLQVSSQSGDIVIRHADAVGAVSAVSLLGNVTVQLTDASGHVPAQVTLGSQTGDLAAKLPAGHEYRVKTTTFGGTTTNSVPSSPSGIPVTLNTKTGEVSVSLE
ncbi:DUF4097 family beta strand repeat-containing protein [Devriesea agamarum]|uniref:hypothetical protein n=1 Tax=Devriesea agamarum TaxID=472569 RepID=UPI00071C542D|nr:hypothetical protein [Devriesea agamarum]